MKPLFNENVSFEDMIEMKDSYIECISLVEQLHRRLLDVIKNELDRTGQTDISNIQALLMFNMGDAELTAGELRSRGYYLGSNVSYSLKKLVDLGYIDHKRSKSDRRSVRVSLTDKGREVRDLVDRLFQRQLGSIAEIGGVDHEALRSTNPILRNIDRFWNEQIMYQL